MNNIKYLFILLLAISFFASCEKENIDTTTIEKEEIVPEEKTTQNALLGRTSGGNQSEALEMGCITISLPFSVVDSDGNVIVVESENAFYELTDSTAEVVIIDFEYPLDVIYKEESVSIVDPTELAELFSECLPGGGWTADAFPAYLIGNENSCYSLAYPINLTDVEGSLQSIANEESFIAQVSEELMFFSYPINIIDSAGTVLEVAGTTELFDYLLSCNSINYEIDSSFLDWQNGFEYIGCYVVDLPYSVVIEGGTEVEIETHEQLCELLLSGVITGYGYPLILTTIEGETEVITNEEEFTEAISACYPEVTMISSDLEILLVGTFPFDSSGVACYDINWPIDVSYTSESGEYFTASVYSPEEIYDLDWASVHLVYPASVTLKSDNSEVIVRSDEDLLALFQSCF